MHIGAAFFRLAQNESAAVKFAGLQCLKSDYWGLKSDYWGRQESGTGTTDGKSTKRKKQVNVNNIRIH